MCLVTELQITRNKNWNNYKKIDIDYSTNIVRYFDTPVLIYRPNRQKNQ